MERVLELEQEGDEMASKFLKSIKDKKDKVPAKKITNAARKREDYVLKVAGPERKVNKRPALARTFGNYRSKTKDY